MNRSLNASSAILVVRSAAESDALKFSRFSRVSNCSPVVVVTTECVVLDRHRPGFRQDYAIRSTWPAAARSHRGYVEWQAHMRDGKLD
jgi:hypothetical protein